jgi:hypothetical protein
MREIHFEFDRRLAITYERPMHFIAVNIWFSNHQ